MFVNRRNLYTRGASRLVCVLLRFDVSMLYLEKCYSDRVLVEEYRLLHYPGNARVWFVPIYDPKERPRFPKVDQIRVSSGLRMP